MALILSLGWLFIVAWLILRAFRQRGVLPELRVAADGHEEANCCVIVPARDESANIGPCVRSLLQQLYQPGTLSVVVVDDESSDDTAEIVAGLAQNAAHLTLVEAPPLPPEWKGKVHACCVGVAAAPKDAEWLCFLDADMRTQSPLLASAVADAQAKHIDFLSLSPRQELGSFAERLMLPCGLYLLSFSQDLRVLQAPDSDDAVATGQCMLVRREAYEALGGHEAVKGEICEDIELARLFKRSGYRVLMEDGSHLLSTRMYRGWEDLWPGIAKNLSDMLGGPTRTAVTVIVTLVLAWAAVLVPAFAITACADGSRTACYATAPALIASGAAFGLHVAGAMHFGIPFWYGLLFPFGYSTGALIALDSLRWRLIRRVRWKGRVYS